MAQKLSLKKFLVTKVFFASSICNEYELGETLNSNSHGFLLFYLNYLKFSSRFKFHLIYLVNLNIPQCNLYLSLDF